MELTEIVERAERVRRDLDAIRTRVTGAVMFVDLVGSTAYKTAHPAEESWLPRLATFLLGVTELVQRRGRVVKYIGDEVMAFFQGDTAVMDAEHTAEEIVSFCQRMEGDGFLAKIALDYGAVSLLDFGGAASSGTEAKGDPNGQIVDRCARINSKAPHQAVLCSKDFRQQSAAASRWKAAGSFKAKGIRRQVQVFQLRLAGLTSIRLGDSAMSLEQCEERLRATETKLAEAKALIRPMPPRPRR